MDGFPELVPRFSLHLAARVAMRPTPLDIDTIAAAILTKQMFLWGFTSSGPKGRAHFERKGIILCFVLVFLWVASFFSCGPISLSFFETSFAPQTKTSFLCCLFFYYFPV